MKNCPFCGSHRIIIVKTSNPSGIAEQCNVCLARGPIVPHMRGGDAPTCNQAMTRWNERSIVGNCHAN